MNLASDPLPERQQPCSPTSRIEIVLGEVEHLPMLSELMDQYRMLCGQPGNRPAAEQFLFERLINHESVIYLALDTNANRPAGFLQLYPGFSSVSLQPLWMLNDLYVTPAYRRHGIAKALIHQAMDLVQARQDKGLMLQTAPNNRAAQALYESMGFQQDMDSSYYVHWL